MAATVWLLPVPGGPVITVSGAFDAEASALSCESLSSMRKTWAARVPVLEPSRTGTAPRSLANRDTRHPLQILDQASGGHIQFALERHHQIEHTDFLGPPGIDKCSRVGQRDRVERVSGQAKDRHQLVCHGHHCLWLAKADEPFSKHCSRRCNKLGREPLCGQQAHVDLGQRFADRHEGWLVGINAQARLVQPTDEQRRNERLSAVVLDNHGRPAVEHTLHVFQAGKERLQRFQQWQGEVISAQDGLRW